MNHLIVQYLKSHQATLKNNTLSWHDLPDELLTMLARNPGLDAPNGVCAIFARELNNSMGGGTSGVLRIAPNEPNQWTCDADIDWPEWSQVIYQYAVLELARRKCGIKVENAARLGELGLDFASGESRQRKLILSASWTEIEARVKNLLKQSA